MKEYTKHKECMPEETIFRIRRLLQEIGVFPVLKWMPDEFRGACSNRVYLDPVYGLGTNGKGTSERYAEASAFYGTGGAPAESFAAHQMLRAGGKPLDDIRQVSG